MSRVLPFARNVLDGWLEADAFSLAATLAYYAIFSIARPFGCSQFISPRFLWSEPPPSKA
jgi:hypothetical protein